MIKYLLLDLIVWISLFYYTYYKSCMGTSFDYKDLTHISNLLLPLRNDSSHSKGHRSQMSIYCGTFFPVAIFNWMDLLMIYISSKMSLLLQLTIQDIYDFRSIYDNWIMNKYIIIYFHQFEYPAWKNKISKCISIIGWNFLSNL